ncbi:hypothetical protein HORIV_24960 [Vreelandella olivaria]|uniref:Carboxyltransferase domain-containing protein n=1 Tax=Vreelandella olivaria TaxID=390919 RepID=A0ABM7GHI6_9GAMM|nr:hypothetical protein HORIV_24960 [Halomonas olivaria]
MTTIQDFPGRQGHWDVGVPPSGPFDDWSFRLGNRLLDNPSDAAGLEITLTGPTLRFHRATQIVLAGARLPATLDGEEVAFWRVVDIPAGATLTLGKAAAGARAYLLVRGGIACPAILALAVPLPWASLVATAAVRCVAAICSIYPCLPPPLKRSWRRR